MGARFAFDQTGRESIANAWRRRAQPSHRCQLLTVPSYCPRRRDLDVVIAAVTGGSQVWENLGVGEGYEFKAVTDAISTGNGVTWGDLDNDGFVDLLVWTPACQPNAMSCAGNVHYRNRGLDASGSHLGFQELTASAISASGDVDSTDGVLADVDGDGDLDVFVANKNAVNFYYTNGGPAVNYTLVRVTGAPFSEGPRTDSVGANFVDYDGDGALGPVSSRADRVPTACQPCADRVPASQGTWISSSPIPAQPITCTRT